MEAILKPYVKKFDKNGELLNPITKWNPYLHKACRDIHQYPNRQQRRSMSVK